MKMMKSLVAVACAVAFLASVSLGLANQSCCVQAKAKAKECTHKCCADAHKAGKVCESCQKDATCCDKAVAKGKACENKCCQEAAKASKVCEKCNPPKTDKKK